MECCPRKPPPPLGRGQYISSTRILPRCRAPDATPRTFEDLAIPFQCVATDVGAGCEAWFSSGPLIEPILASASLPAIYPAVEIGGARYPDGGIVADVLLDLEMRLEETLAACRVGELPEIEADATQMRQLFQNLLGNALKFAAKDRRLEVLVKAEADVEPTTQQPVIRITIQDNGIGFDARYAERIFSPFQRLHSRSEYEGTGIGLATCRKIVDRHNGTIAAKSKPGAGATFIVTLPVEQIVQE